MPAEAESVCRSGEYGHSNDHIAETGGPIGMTMRRVAVLLVAGVAAAVMATPAMAAKKPPKINAEFGAGLTFDVKRGKKVLSTGSSGSITLKARKYRFVLKDDSEFHNFQLENASDQIIKGKKGKRSRKVMTSVQGTLKKPAVFVVNLKRGQTYQLLCQPHRDVGMTVDITVR